MRRFHLEVIVGLFVVIGLCALGYLSVRLGKVQMGRGNTYDLTAVFPSIAGLRVGASVEIAGVQIGRVQDLALVDYNATLTLRLEKSVLLQEDAIASIRTRGLIGEKYVSITPGGSERLLTAGGRIREVEPPVDFETLIGRFVQGKF